MPRSIWTGAISFGLVTVPVKLYSAVQRKTVRFHQLNQQTGSRIKQQRVDASTGDEVAFENLVKGYELSPDRYVVIDPEELDTLSPEKTKTIDIEDFVSLDDIDPVFYDAPYYLVPGPGGAKPYRLLLEAMEASGKVAIARFVLRSKESLVALRPMGDVLALETMLFGDEVVDPGKLDELPSASDVKTTQRELDIAHQLIDSLAADWDPERYRDTYREQVLELIERKAAGEEIAIQPQAEEETQPVPDLMAALKASLDAVRDRTGTAAAKPQAKARGSAAKKAASKKPAAKKAAAKKPAAKKPAAKKPAAKKPAAKKPAAKKPAAKKRAAAKK